MKKMRNGFAAFAYFADLLFNCGRISQIAYHGGKSDIF